MMKEDSMKEIKGFVMNGRSLGISLDDAERITFIPSGYKGAWIVVYEDPAYNVSASYATEEEYKLFNLLKTKGE